MSWVTDGPYLTNQIVPRADLVHGQSHQHPPVDNLPPNGPMHTTNNSEMGVGMQGNRLASAQDQITSPTVQQQDGRGGLAPAQTLNQDQLEHFQPAATTLSFEELLSQLLPDDQDVSSLLLSINGGNNPHTTQCTTPLNSGDVPLDSGTEQPNNQPLSGMSSTSQQTDEPQKKEYRDQAQQVTFPELKNAIAAEKMKARRKEQRARDTALRNKKLEDITDPNEAARKKHLEKLNDARNAKSRARRQNMDDAKKEKRRNYYRNYMEKNKEKDLKKRIIDQAPGAQPSTTHGQSELN